MNVRCRKNAAVTCGTDRLRPSRLGRTYWHLICLRNAIGGMIERHVAGRSMMTLVDYGCGTMPYRPMFEPHIETYIACDLSGNVLADVPLDKDGRLPLADACADIVLSSQVLEHVPNPQLYLSESWRVLQPGGLLMLSTHGVWGYHPDPTDYWRWTSQGLPKIIEMSGFQMVEFQGIMGSAAYGLQIFQDAVGGSLWRPLTTAWFACMQLLIQVVDRASSASARQQDAGVYVVVACKQPDCAGTNPING